MKVKFTANKLEDATAEYISLVPRGANRLPFKIKKSANPENEDMINIDGNKLNLADLATVIKSDGKPKKDAVQKTAEAKLVAIVVQKGDYLTAEVLAKLAEATGLDITKKSESEDGTVVFGLDNDADIDKAIVVKFDHSLALFEGLDAIKVVKGTAFEKHYADHGFLPSPIDANRMAQDIVSKAVQKGDKDELATARKSGDEMTTGYVDVLAALIPQTAYKGYSLMHDVISKWEPPAKEGDKPAAGEGADAKPAEAKPADSAPAVAGGKPDGVDQAAWDAMSADEKAAVMAASKETTAKADVKPADPVLKAEDVATIVAKAVADALAPVTASLTAVQKSVGEVQAAQTAQKSALDEVTAKVSKTDATLNKTVIGAMPAADHGEGKRVERKEERTTLSNLDTAYGDPRTTRKGDRAARRAGH